MPNPSMSIEQLLLVITAMLVPGIVGVSWVVFRIARLEAKIESLHMIKNAEQFALLSRIEKLETHIHELRNTVQALTLAVVKGSFNAKDQSSDFDGFTG
jgi:hypothetical protein